jgi:hypothetical protein
MSLFLWLAVGFILGYVLTDRPEEEIVFEDGQGQGEDYE